MNQTRQRARENGQRGSSAPADKARGGEDTPLKRWVFIAGLAGAVVLVVVLSFFR
jgi:hypothetical protein